MTKFKTFRVLSLIIALVAFLAAGACIFAGNAPIAANAEAEAVAPEGAPAGPDDTEHNAEDDTLRALVDGFLARLKAKYGDDYETYYNAILAEWGSVEEYLLSLVTEDTPDVVASGWGKFVKWLGDYSPVWASVFAIAIVIMLILIGRRALSKIGGWASGNKKQMKTVFSTFNKHSRGLIAVQRFLLKFAGENERFKGERKALEESIKEIETDENV